MSRTPSVRTATAALVAAGLMTVAGATTAAAAPTAAPSEAPTAAPSEAPTAVAAEDPPVVPGQEYTGHGVAPRRGRAVSLAEADAFRQAGQDGRDLTTCVEARPPAVTYEPLLRPLPWPLPIERGMWRAEYYLRCGGPDIPPPRPPKDEGFVDLVRYRIPDSASYASHIEPMPNPPYVWDRLLGRLLVEPAKGTHALYQCQVGWNPPRTTTDPNEGTCIRLGLAYDAQESGSVPLYRCPVPELGRYGSMDSTDPQCEGRTNPKLPIGQPPELLGYIDSLFVPV